MSLDVYLNVEVDGNEVNLYTDNITHNLNTMAEAAGIYEHLWRPENLNITHAKELIEPLTEGLARLKSNPDKYKEFNAANGCGVYENLVRFVRDYLAYCKKFPSAEIRVSR